MSWPIVLIVTAVTAVAVKTAVGYNRLVGHRNAYLRCSVAAPLGKRCGNLAVPRFGQFSLM
jgi:hypothetical protein